MNEGFLHVTPIGCLGTSDKKGNVSNAYMFFVLRKDKFYLVTHKKSLKVKHIKENPNVCFVVSDTITYEQLQLYAIAKIVDVPDAKIMKDIMAVIQRHSLKTDRWIPYMEQEVNKIDKTDVVVVIELTPKKHKLFNSDQGIVDQQTVGF